MASSLNDFVFQYVYGPRRRWGGGSSRCFIGSFCLMIAVCALCWSAPIFQFAALMVPCTCARVPANLFSLRSRRSHMVQPRIIPTANSSGDRQAALTNETPAAAITRRQKNTGEYPPSATGDGNIFRFGYLPRESKTATSAGRRSSMLQLHVNGGAGSLTFSTHSRKETKDLGASSTCGPASSSGVRSTTGGRQHPLSMLTQESLAKASQRNQHRAANLMSPPLSPGHILHYDEVLHGNDEAVHPGSSAPRGLSNTPSPPEQSASGGAAAAGSSRVTENPQSREEPAVAQGSGGQPQAHSGPSHLLTTSRKRSAPKPYKAETEQGESGDTSGGSRKATAPRSKMFCAPCCTLPKTHRGQLPGSSGVGAGASMTPQQRSISPVASMTPTRLGMMSRSARIVLTRSQGEGSYNGANGFLPVPEGCQPLNAQLFARQASATAAAGTQAGFPSPVVSLPLEGMTSVMSRYSPFLHQRTDPYQSRSVAHIMRGVDPFLPLPPGRLRHEQPRSHFDWPGGLQPEDFFVRVSATRPLTGALDVPAPTEGNGERTGKPRNKLPDPGLRERAILGLMADHNYHVSGKSQMRGVTGLIARKLSSHCATSREPHQRDATGVEDGVSSGHFVQLAARKTSEIQTLSRPMAISARPGFFRGILPLVTAADAAPITAREKSVRLKTRVLLTRSEAPALLRTAAGTRAPYFNWRTGLAAGEEPVTAKVAEGGNACRRLVGGDPAGTPTGAGLHTKRLADVKEHPLDIVGMLFIAIASAIAVAAGAGGGAIYVPILILLMKFSPYEAVATSQALIFGGSLAGTILNFFRRNPRCPERPVIDVEMVMLMGPMQIAGAMMGMVVNRCLPTYIILAVLVLLLLFVSYKTLLQAIRLKRESREVAPEAHLGGADSLIMLQDDADDDAVSDERSMVGARHEQIKKRKEAARNKEAGMGRKDEEARDDEDKEKEEGMNEQNVRVHHRYFQHQDGKQQEVMNAKLGKEEEEGLHAQHSQEQQQRRVEVVLLDVGQQPKNDGQLSEKQQSFHAQEQLSANCVGLPGPEAKGRKQPGEIEGDQSKQSVLKKKYENAEHSTNEEIVKSQPQRWQQEPRQQEVQLQQRCSAFKKELECVEEHPTSLAQLHKKEGKTAGSPTCNLRPGIPACKLHEATINEEGLLHVGRRGEKTLGARMGRLCLGKRDTAGAFSVGSSKSNSSTRSSESCSRSTSPFDVDLDESVYGPKEMNRHTSQALAVFYSLSSTAETERGDKEERLFTTDAITAAAPISAAESIFRASFPHESEADSLAQHAAVLENSNTELPSVRAAGRTSSTFVTNHVSKVLSAANDVEYKKVADAAAVIETAVGEIPRANGHGNNEKVLHVHLRSTCCTTCGQVQDEEGAVRCETHQKNVSPASKGPTKARVLPKLFGRDPCGRCSAMLKALEKRTRGHSWKKWGIVLVLYAANLLITFLKGGPKHSPLQIVKYCNGGYWALYAAGVALLVSSSYVVGVFFWRRRGKQGAVGSAASITTAKPALTSVAAGAPDVAAGGSAPAFVGADISCSSGAASAAAREGFRSTALAGVTPAVSSANVGAATATAVVNSSVGTAADQTITINTNDGRGTGVCISTVNGGTGNTQQREVLTEDYHHQRREEEKRKQSTATVQGESRGPASADSGTQQHLPAHKRETGKRQLRRRRTKPQIQDALSYSCTTVHKLLVVSFLAGLMAGLVGIGGGLILGPVLLSYGVHPAVSAAVNAALILFTSSSAAALSLSSSAAPLDYSLVFFGICFASTLTGKALVDTLVKKYHASYVLVMLLLVIIICSVCFSVASGILNLLKRDPRDFRFKAPCD